MSSVPALSQIEALLADTSSDRRREALRSPTDLFAASAASCSQATTASTDAVFRLLVAHVEKEARAELANRLAHIPNAPAETIRRLASDDEIGVADPVLRHSTQLDDADLRRIAGTKGQGHLLAISARPTLTPPVTDILVSRGNREVLSSVAGNAGARFSEQGFAELVERAAGDEGLQERLAERGDLSPARMQSLLARATDLVREKLTALLDPAFAAELGPALRVAMARPLPMPGFGRRDYAAAQKQVDYLARSDRLNEAALAGFARSLRFEPTVCALAKLCDLSRDTAKALMLGTRTEPLLVLCRASAFAFATMSALLRCSVAGASLSRDTLEQEIEAVEQCSVASAQRVIRFWRVREAAMRQQAG